MCNLYSLTKGQAAILELTRAMVDRTGNLPPMPGIFPDYPAPIVRERAAGRELALARWRMPSPVFALKGRTTDAGGSRTCDTSLRRPGAGWGRRQALSEQDDVALLQRDRSRKADGVVGHAVAVEVGVERGLLLSTGIAQF
jgi:hypothetical protein